MFTLHALPGQQSDFQLIVSVLATRRSILERGSTADNCRFDHPVFSMLPRGGSTGQNIGLSIYSALV